MAKAKKKQESAPDEEGLNIRTYKVPEGKDEDGNPRRKAGWWTFTVNGKDSHWYSNTEKGLDRVIRALLSGPPTGTVVLKPLTGKGSARVHGGDTQEATAAENPEGWADHDTRAARVEAFLNRGRLKDGVLQPAGEQ